MDIDKLPSNSNRTKSSLEDPTVGALPKPRPSQPKKVATGRIGRKAGLGGLVRSFFEEDLRSVGEYVLTDVVVPKAKTLLVDAVNSGVNMLVNGRGSASQSAVPASRVSYHEIGKQKAAREEPMRTSRMLGYNDVFVPRREDAENVIAQLEDFLDEYGSVSVGQFYEATGMTTDQTCYEYGWHDLRDAGYVRVKDGWQFRMPPVRPLGRD